MPLAGPTIFALLNDVVLGRQVIDSRADATPNGAPYANQIGAACENWAIRALQANVIDPPAVFDDIRTTGGALGPVAGTGHAAAGLVIKNRIRATFGYEYNMNIPAIPVLNPDPMDVIPDTIALRNANRANLHDDTAAVFELCLTFNGFTLSNAATDYMVCMEYERARTQAMYPNFTHAWLMFRQKRIIQTITGSFISASRHHAGHQAHCGFIRRYVTDFHANQIQVIAGMMANQKMTNRVTDDVLHIPGVTVCDLDNDIGTEVWPLDEQSPNE